jgi:hypothetical protein
MFNGLPPLDAPPSVQMLGEVDVSRNGAHTGGIAADLRRPDTPVEQAAVPGLTKLGSPVVVLAVVVIGFIVLNGRSRK